MDLFNVISRVLAEHEPNNERVHYGSASVLAHELAVAVTRHFEEAGTDGASE